MVALQTYRGRRLYQKRCSRLERNWVKGKLVEGAGFGELYIRTSFTDPETGKTKQANIQIARATLGRATGFRDFSPMQSEIFEGDIVLLADVATGKRGNYLVTIDPETEAVVLVERWSKERTALLEELRDTDVRVYIRGNIHDDAELLGFVEHLEHKPQL